MTLTDLLDALDATIAQCRRTRPRRREVVLRLHSPTPHLLVEAGWRLPDSDLDARPLYGYTLRQVERMRERLEEALLEEADLLDTSR